MSVVVAPGSLLRLGTWQEGPWGYPSGPHAMKSFGWSCPAVTIHGQQTLTLSYGAVARCERQRMEDLAYVAERERAARGELEAMVAMTLVGVGYAMRPNPADFLTQTVAGLIQSWVTAGGYPDDWPVQVRAVVTEGCRILTNWSEVLALVHAEDDSDHPRWGLRIAIEPLRILDDTTTEPA